jgi:hypothetical protein
MIIFSNCEFVFIFLSLSHSVLRSFACVYVYGRVYVKVKLAKFPHQSCSQITPKTSIKSFYKRKNYDERVSFAMKSACGPIKMKLRKKLLWLSLTIEFFYFTSHKNLFYSSMIFAFNSTHTFMPFMNIELEIVIKRSKKQCRCDMIKCTTYTRNIILHEK